MPSASYPQSIGPLSAASQGSDVREAGSLSRELLYGLDGLGGAPPALKLQLLRLHRIGRLEELLQLVDWPCRQAPDVLQVAFKGRTVGNDEHTIVALFSVL